MLQMQYRLPQLLHSDQHTDDIAEDSGSEDEEEDVEEAPMMEE